MKNKHLLKSLTALVLAFQMLLSPIAGSVVYATGPLSIFDEMDETTAGASQGIESEIIPPQDRPDELIGDAIITKEGFKIKMNADGASYTVLEYMGSSEVVDIIATYAELDKPAYPITRIADTAFYGNKSVKTITIPSTVVFVGEYAFSACPNLEYNVIDGGNYIGSAASPDGSVPANPCFYFDSPEDTDCAQFTVHNDTVIVGAYAFAACKNIKKVVIGEKVISIGYAAMGKASEVEDLTVPFLGENGKSDRNGFLGFVFGARTYGGNISYVPQSLSSLSVTGGEYIARNALYGMDTITSLTLPYLGASLGDTKTNYLSYVFGGKSYEDNAYLPEALKSVTVLGGEIGENAFRNTKLTSVTIGNGVTSIGDNAFYECSSLTGVYISDIAAWCNINFANDDANPLYYARKLYLNGTLVTELNIPNSVTSIGRYTFSYCSSLTSITIPNSVTSIGYDAFEYCWSLTNVTIGDSVTRIDGSAFRGCSSLTSITIPNSVTSIGSFAFEDCSSLTSITIPNSVTSIGSFAFSYCSSLTGVYISDIAAWCNINFADVGANPLAYAKKLYLNGTLVTELNIPNSVTSIGEYAFYGCSSLISITIPNSVTRIGSAAFRGCSGLTSVAIPNSVTSIGDHAFYSCSSLTSITIPESVKSIVSATFRNCSSLTSITIPNSVKSIGSNAFFDCNSLKNAYYNGSRTEWKTKVKVSSGNDNLINALVFMKEDSTNAEEKSEISTKTVDKTEVSAINNKSDTFNNQSATVKLNVQTTNSGSVGLRFESNGDGTCSVTGIGTCKDNDLIIPSVSPSGDIVTSIGYCAFFRCRSLTSITIPNSVTSIGEGAFDDCSSLTSITIPNSVTSIGKSAFYWCSSLTGVYISDIAAWCNINFANDDANPLYYAKKLYLNGTLVTELNIPNSVTSIGSYAFRGCSSLTSVTISNSVTSIAYQAFFGCSSLTGVYISDIAAWCNINFANDDANPLYYANKLYLNGTLVTELNIPNSVTSIGSSAFRGCSSLTSVTIPNSVTSIGSSAFEYCRSLTNVTVGDSVTSIGRYAFFRCNSLTSVTIPNSVTSIGRSAFYDCSSLNSVYISDIAAWCNINFANDDANPLAYAKKLYLNGTLVTELNIPNSVTSIGDYAFYNYSRLTSVTISNSVTSIGNEAFYSCYYLTNVTLGNGLSSIGNRAFYWCNLTSITIPNGVTSIGDSAFYECISLTSVTIPNSIIKIDSKAFSGCTNLSTVTYDGEPNEWRHVQKATDWAGNSGIDKPDFLREDSGLLYDADENLEHFWISGFKAQGTASTDAKAPAVYSGRPVTVVYAKAFDGNTELTSLELQDSIVEIGESAFRNCSSLKKVNLPPSLLTVEFGIFTGCSSLENLELPFIGQTEDFENNEYLGYYFGAPSSAENESYIPSSLKTVKVLKAQEIAESCFKNCRYIESITLPEGITKIVKYAFSGCSALNSFEIPNSVTKVEEMIFDGCSAIKTIKIGDNLETICDYAEGTPLFGINKSRSVLQSYVVSENNKTYSADEHGVLYRLFEVDGTRVRVSVMDAPAMSNLSKYVLPELIVEISPYAFAYNSTLRSIDLRYVRRIANNAFYKADGLIYVKLHYTEEESDEYKAQNDKLNGVLQQLEINQYIGNEAFMGCTSLMSVDIASDNIVGIGDFAFADCSSLTDVALGRKIKRLGLSAFGATESGESNIEWFEVHKDNEYFKSIDGVLYSIFDGNLTLEIFPAMAIQSRNNRVVRKEYTLPADQNIVAIQSYAFRGVKGLQKLFIYSGKDMIVGDYAFANSSITNVDIGKNVTSLGIKRGESEYTVFDGMEYLEAITVSTDNRYYSAKDGVLFDKKQQKLIKYPSKKTEDEYYVPNTVHSISSMAFKNNTKLKLTVITSYISTVGLEAFYGCSELYLIYFKDVYAPTSIMENAFATFVKIEGGSATNPRTQIGYTDSYYDDGADGEYGWKNYKGIYNLVANPDTDIRVIDGDADFYGIVVVDSTGTRLGNMLITLTDPNGVSETVKSGYSTEGQGIAIFFDLYGSEGLGFSIDYENSYSITVTDPNGEYFAFTNPSFYLDENMKITYITLTREPSAYGLTCDETDINSERAELNKSEYEYTVSLDKDGNVVQEGQDGAVSQQVIHQTVEISVVAYCDKGYRFIDENGNPLPGVAALYQNGVKIVDASRAESREDGGVVLYFTPEVHMLAEETDIEVRVTAMHDSAEALSCRTVLNIHVFNFIVTDEDVDLDFDDIEVDLDAGGELLKKLLGANSLKIGSDFELFYNIDKDTITLGVEGKKKILDKKGKAIVDYKEGYEANCGSHEKNTYLFSYRTVFIDTVKGPRIIKYNIRFARGTEDEGYYYYCCRIYDVTGTSRADDSNIKTTFYGLVNKPKIKSWKDRNAAKLKATIIFKTHSAYFFQTKTNDNTGKKERVYMFVNDIKKISGKYTELVWWNQELKNQKQSSNKLDIEFSGDIKLKYEDGGIKPVSSTIKGKLIYTFTHNQQIMVWAIPVTIEVEVKASGEIKLKFGLDENEKFGFEELLLTLGLDINAKVGIGCSVASVGLYGKVGTVLIIELAPKAHVESWKVSGELGGYLKLLFFEKTLKFTPESWAEGYYIVGSPSEEGTSAAGYEFSEKAALASMYLADSYTSIDSSDLDEYFELVIIDGKLYKLCYADVSGNSKYDEYNYVKFALSKWNEESGKWEEPVIIDDNGFNDAAYSFYRDGDSLFMVYTQQTEKMTADTINDTYASAKGLAIKVVELTENGIQSKPIGKRENYAYLAQYSLVNGVPTVVWAENADNNIFGVSPYNYIDNENGDNPLAESHVFETKANSIWVSRFVNNEWSNPECIEKELSAVTQLALNEKGVIAYVIDKNGDLASTNDRVMYYGSIDGFRSSLNNTDEGSVVYVTAEKNGFVYYYDEMYTEGEEEDDGWYTITTNISGEIYSIPRNAPMEFVSVFDENGNLSGIVYSSNKKWIDDTGTERIGSAVYAIFVNDGVWGEPVEIDSFAAEADRYVYHLSAAMRSKNLTLTVNTVDASGEAMKQIQCEYICEPKLCIEDYTVDYPGGTVSLEVTNVGAAKTPVYISLDGGAYTLMTSESLNSGESVSHTLSIPDSSRQHRIDVAMSASGKGAKSIEDISLTYSDLQPFAKQILLADKNVLLLAVRNTGNVANTGTTVIRVGSNDAESIVSSAMREKINALTLTEGEVKFIKPADENEKAESFWVVKDSIDAGGIVYHEIDLSENDEISDGSLIGIYTTPKSVIENGYASENNFTYLNYNQCAGILQEGEEIESAPKLADSVINYDPENEQDITLRFLCSDEDSISKIMVDGQIVPNSDYIITDMLVGGTVAISHISETVNKLSAGQHTITVIFNGNEECKVKLKVTAYYTVKWVDGDTELATQEKVKEGTIPSYEAIPEKEHPDNSLVYVFAGWDSNGDGKADIISAINMDTTYCAVWKDVPKTHTITWRLRDAYGNECEVSEKYTHNSLPNYKGTIPAPTKMIFSGWDKEIVKATEDAVYTAVYTSMTVGSACILNTKIETAPGLTFSTGLRYTDIANMTSSTVKIYYDTDIVALKGLTCAENVSVVDSGDGYVTILITDFEGMNEKELATFEFTTNASLAEGEYDFLRAESEDNVSSAFDKLRVYQRGDINNDGKINTKDLLLLKQYVLGKIELSDVQLVYCNIYVDYNSDGSVIINTKDILLLKQKILGIID